MSKAKTEQGTARFLVGEQLCSPVVEELPVPAHEQNRVQQRTDPEPKDFVISSNAGTFTERLVEDRIEALVEYSGESRDTVEAWDFVAFDFVDAVVPFGGTTHGDVVNWLLESSGPNFAGRYSVVNVRANV